MISRLKLIRMWMLCMATSIMLPAMSQDAPIAAGKLSAEYLPADAIGMIVFPVRQTMSQPEMEWLPIEIAQAQMIESVGVDLMDIEDVRVVIGMPGPAGPVGGIVVHLAKDYDISDLKEPFLISKEPIEENGLMVYAIDGPPGSVLHLRDARTMVLSMGGYLPAMLDAKPDSGPLSRLVRGLTARDGVTAVIVMEPIRPIVSAVLSQQVNRLPNEFRDLSKLPDLIDALMIHMEIGLMSGSGSLAMLSPDESKAEELEKLLRTTIDQGKEMAVNMAKMSVGGESTVDQATRQYIDRISNKIVAIIQPQQSGKVVKVELEGGSMATTGVLVGLLLPAVQAAREAARRMSASNGLKQIGLGMHNHHASYRNLPDTAIRSEDGTPLLSWRVKLLPFIEQEELYQQFKLDEPWDSSHNIKLLPMMPDVYVDPSVPLPEGHTVFQVPVGTSLVFEEQGERKFRDVLDGLSNTIMVVEASAANAVPWTKPEDLKINMEDPAADLGGAHANGWHVLFADGAVRFMANNIDPEMLRRMLTRAGKEQIDFDF